MLNFEDEEQAAPAADQGAAGRVRSEDKRAINGHSDVNQLVPLKYNWAWEKYLASCANHWMPQEVNMQRDIELWKSRDGLSEDERLIIKRNLGFFVTADSLAANNIVLGTYRQVTAPECRQFLLRQAFEEAIHCYVDGTEILTERGFLDFRELPAGVKVAQYWPDGRIDFVEPDEVLHDRHRGEMIRFHNDSGTYDSVVTPEHRCVAIDPRHGNECRIILAKDFSPANYNVPVAGQAKPFGKARELSWTERFQIAFQADGNLMNTHVVEVGKISGARGVRFQFARLDKIERMSLMLDALGWDYTLSPIDDDKSKNFGHQVFHVKAALEVPLDKEFAWVELPSVDAHWGGEFIAELAHWDGCAREAESVCYTNGNWAACQKIIEIATLSGFRAGTYEVAPTGGRKPAWQLHLYDKAHVSGKSLRKETVLHDGHVHCVGVPSGMIVTRYNGCITVSGNTHAYQYIVESLGMDEAEVFNAYREVSCIKAKDDFLIPFIDTLSDPAFKTGTPKTDAQFLKSLIVFACIMEGLFFYVGFTQILAMGRQNKMVGAAEQFQYILRDESMHCNFGIDLINTIKAENPGIWTPSFQSEILDLMRQGVDLEEAYAKDTMPRGVLGLNAGQFAGYLRFVANRRCVQIGLPEIYPGADNPFPWMSEMIDLRKERNFFETRVTEYQTGGALSWD